MLDLHQRKSALSGRDGIGIQKRQAAITFNIVETPKKQQHLKIVPYMIQIFNSLFISQNQMDKKKGRN